MHKIEKTDFGFKILLSGLITMKEMQKWHEEALKKISNVDSEFGVLFDMRYLNKLLPSAMSIFGKGYRTYREKGMLRTIMVFNCQIKTQQAIRIGESSNDSEYERYIDASSRMNWENVAIDWIKYGADPDVNVKSNNSLLNRVM